MKRILKKIMTIRLITIIMSLNPIDVLIVLSLFITWINVRIFFRWISQFSFILLANISITILTLYSLQFYQTFNKTWSINILVQTLAKENNLSRNSIILTRECKKGNVHKKNCQKVNKSTPKSHSKSSSCFA